MFVPMTSELNIEAENSVEGNFDRGTFWARLNFREDVFGEGSKEINKNTSEKSRAHRSGIA